MSSGTLWKPWSRVRDYEEGEVREDGELNPRLPGRSGGRDLSLLGVYSRQVERDMEWIFRERQWIEEFGWLYRDSGEWYKK